MLKTTGIILILLFGGVLIYVAEDIPPLGDPNSPSLKYVKLFRVDVAESDNPLEQGEIPETLTTAFKERGFPLPSRVVKIPDTEGQWNAYVPKEEAHYPKEEKYYWMNKEGDHLQVYRYAFVARWIEKGFEETNVPNMVTHGLADYRGYDTMGETVVIFTAGVSVILLLRRRSRL